MQRKELTSRPRRRAIRSQSSSLLLILACVSHPLVLQYMTVPLSDTLTNSRNSPFLPNPHKYPSNPSSVMLANHSLPTADDCSFARLTICAHADTAEARRRVAEGVERRGVEERAEGRRLGSVLALVSRMEKWRRRAARDESQESAEYK